MTDNAGAQTADNTSDLTNTVRQFELDIKSVQSFFHIPGMAVLVTQGDQTILEKYLGVSDLEHQTPVTAKTRFPIASLTKMFAGALIMQLVDEGTFQLSTPVVDLVPEAPVGDSIEIRHLLSHTSQGEVGTHFLYSSRFSWLSRIVEKTTGTTFREHLSTRFLEPLQLTQTGFYTEEDLPDLQPVAHPYLWTEEGPEPGPDDFGVSASAGLVSTVRDLATWQQALFQGAILSETGKEIFFQPFGKKNPYGYGLFFQNIDNQNIVWSYGQYDGFAALFMVVPDRDLTLIALANNNLMSDAARLIYGDVTYSLLGLSFLRHFVLDAAEIPLFPDPGMVASTDIQRISLQTRALNESFMARYNANLVNSSTKIIQNLRVQYPNVQDWGDLQTMHTISFLNSVRLQRDLPPDTSLDPILLEIGQDILQSSPNNPYVHSYLALLHDQIGNTEEARSHYQHIVDAPNFSPHWYTREAQRWLEGRE